MDKSVGLRSWMWRAFVQSALIPLILVETVLLATYLLTNNAIRDAQVEYLRSAARVDLEAAASQQAKLISERLQGVSELTSLFAGQAAEVLSRPADVDDPEERQRLVRNADGVLYSQYAPERSASFYSAVTPAAEQDIDKVVRLSQLDGMMRAIEQNNALVAAVYFNSHDSYNRIWPWFDTPAQYPADMNIPHFNFYYLADAEQNPERDVVWTDAYLDPAGLGWTMSALAPVYRGDFLEGVVGLDITVGNVLADIAELQVPWSGYAMLVSDELNIMALPEQGENDLQLTELTDYTYNEAIRQEIFKPGDFNLSQRIDMRDLGQRMADQAQGVVTLSLAGQPKLAAWTTVPETGWHLLMVVDEAAIFAQTNQLASHYRNIGLLLIVGLVLFYLLFFIGMWIRSRQLSAQLQKPIEHIGEMLQDIGNGHWNPPAERTRIKELASMIETTRQVGQQLAELEQGRQEARDQVDRVLESTTESLWEVDLQTHEIGFQGRLPGRLGLAADRLPLAEFFQRIHPDDLPVARASLLAQRPRKKIEAEYRLRDATGAYLWVLARGQVIKLDAVGRKALRIAGTHVDIGALKATEEALRAASRQAQAASLAKSRFLSSMSHELRTPLNIIQGFAQLLEGDLSDNAEHRRFRHQVGEILKASQHLCLLVDDVLDLARIEAERPTIKLETVDAGQLLRDCIEQVRPDIDAAGLRLYMQAPEHGALVTAEPRRLRQIVLNLLNNAIKYNRTPGEITVDCLPLQTTWQLRIADTGRGISRANQKQLFKPFQRLGHENGPIKGTGIGLALSRELAGLMDGQLGFTSEEGEGSCFWVELPAALPTPFRAAQAAPGAELLNVVYVEDDRSSRILVEHALADMAQVTMIENGLEALHRITEQPPQVLLLDIDLPDMQGDRLLRSLRSSARTRDLPVIVITAGATLADRERVADLDVAVYLTKPLQIQDLRDALRIVARLQSGNG